MNKDMNINQMSSDMRSVPDQEIYQPVSINCIHRYLDQSGLFVGGVCSSLVLSAGDLTLLLV